MLARQSGRVVKVVEVPDVEFPTAEFRTLPASELLGLWVVGRFESYRETEAEPDKTATGFVSVILGPLARVNGMIEPSVARIYELDALPMGRRIALSVAPFITRTGALMYRVDRVALVED